MQIFLQLFFCFFLPSMIALLCRRYRIAKSVFRFSIYIFRFGQYHFARKDSILLTLCTKTTVFGKRNS